MARRGGGGRRGGGRRRGSRSSGGRSHAAHAAHMARALSHTTPHVRHYSSPEKAGSVMAILKEAERRLELESVQEFMRSANHANSSKNKDMKWISKALAEVGAAVERAQAKANKLKDGPEKEKLLAKIKKVDSFIRNNINTKFLGVFQKSSQQTTQLGSASRAKTKAEAKHAEKIQRAEKRAWRKAESTAANRNYIRRKYGRPGRFSAKHFYKVTQPHMSMNESPMVLLREAERLINLSDVQKFMGKAKKAQMSGHRDLAWIDKALVEVKAVIKRAKSKANKMEPGSTEKEKLLGKIEKLENFIENNINTRFLGVYAQQQTAAAQNTQIAGAQKEAPKTVEKEQETNDSEVAQKKEAPAKSNPVKTERSPSNLSKAKIENITSKMESLGWTAAQPDSSTSKTQPLTVTKDSESFQVDINKFTSSSSELATFTAMLEAFKVASPNEVPAVKTNNPELKETWQQAYNEVYPDKPMPSNFVTVEAPKPPEKKADVESKQDYQQEHEIETPRAGMR